MYGNSHERPVVRGGERATGRNLGLGLNADVQNSDSIEGARIPVGEEARNSPATVAEAGGGAGRRRLTGWWFNVGGGAVSKLGFPGAVVAVSSGDIPGHRSFKGGGGERRTGGGFAVKRCDEAAASASGGGRGRRRRGGPEGAGQGGGGRRGAGGGR
jgi:hypothetical protein